jgi:glycosyltransferase involved in cell wall biosynthesis
MPAYNARAYIAEAIDSVLAQTFEDYEIVVVDDGSTDDTAGVLRPYASRIHYIRQQNQGLAAARNAGARAARGQYLAFLDSDDRFLPHKLALQVAALDVNPSVGLVASGHEYINSQGHCIQAAEREHLSQPVTLESLLFDGLAPVHAVLVRRAWFTSVNGFDITQRAAEDMDLWFQLALAGCDIQWLPGVVCQYRIHGANMSRRVQEHFAYIYRALDRVFEDPRLPVSLVARKGAVYGRVRAAEAVRLYGAGDYASARECLLEAMRLDPRLRERGGQGVAEILITGQRSVWATNREHFVETMLVELPPRSTLPHGLVGRVVLAAMKSAFYAALSQGNLAEVRRLWPRLALRDASFLLNRGTWSILAQSLRQRR